jgi:hypothetical protein
MVATHCIVPVPDDLQRDKNDYIVLGIGTKTVCKRAVALAREIPDSFIFVAAGRISKYDRVEMCGVIETYLRQKTRSIVIKAAEALCHGRLHEIRALITFLEANPDVNEVTFVVKESQAHLMKCLARAALKLNHLDHVSLHFEPCYVPGKSWEKLFEPFLTAHHLSALYRA